MDQQSDAEDQAAGGQAEEGQEGVQSYSAGPKESFDCCPRAEKDSSY